MLRMPMVIRPSTCAPLTESSIIASNSLVTAGSASTCIRWFLSRKMKCSENTPACGATEAALAVDGDDEVDVAGADLLQHHRLLAELRAGELIDAHRAFAQFHELGIEHVGGDAVGGRMRLVVAEGVFLEFGVGAGGHGKRHDTGGKSRACENSDSVSH